MISCHLTGLTSGRDDVALFVEEKENNFILSFLEDSFAAASVNV